jgi:hypothetical protein
MSRLLSGLFRINLRRILLLRDETGDSLHAFAAMDTQLAENAEEPLQQMDFFRIEEITVGAIQADSDTAVRLVLRQIIDSPSSQAFDQAA